MNQTKTIGLVLGFIVILLVLGAGITFVVFRFVGEESINQAVEKHQTTVTNPAISENPTEQQISITEFAEVAQIQKNSTELKFPESKVRVEFKTENLDEYNEAFFNLETKKYEDIEVSDFLKQDTTDWMSNMHHITKEDVYIYPEPSSAIKIQMIGQMKFDNLQREEKQKNDEFDTDINCKRLDQKVKIAEQDFFAIECSHTVTFKAENYQSTTKNTSCVLPLDDQKYLLVEYVLQGNSADVDSCKFLSDSLNLKELKVSNMIGL